MFPILLAELRPLFFRNRLWSDKDESFKAVFDVLTYTTCQFTNNPVLSGCGAIETVICVGGMG